MKIAIVTPAGNIGSHLVEYLRKASAELVLLDRKPERLPEAVRNQAEIRQGDMADKEFLIEATQGVEALFWLTPYSLSEPHQDARYEKLMSSVSGAVTENSIPYVVNLSTFGAQKREGAGFASYVGKMEDCLNATGASVLHLRPGFFMENYFMVLPWMRDQNLVTLPLPGTTALPFTAVRDIAEVVGKKLRERDWQGQVIQAVHGPADLSQAEAVAILSDAIGKPLQYVEASFPMFRDVLQGMGASEEGIRCDIELMQAFAEPGIVAESRRPETTTSTTLYEWGRTILKPMLDNK